MNNPPSKPNESLAPHFALIAVQIFFGASAIMGKLALLGFPPMAIVGCRVGGGALAFYILQRFRGNLHLDKKIHYLYFAVFALFGIVFNQLLFFTGLSMTTATNTSLLAVLIPVFTIVVSSFVGNDVLTWRKISGIVIAALGVIYLIDPRQASFSSTTTQGDMLIILNSLSYAVYLAISKKLITRYGALKSIAWLFIFGSLINVPIGMYSFQSVELAQVTFIPWLALGGIVIISTILAYYFNAWALVRVEPSVVAVYIYLQPLIGTFLAITVLGEPWKPKIIGAMLLIFTGVYLVTKKRKQSNSALSDLE